MARLARIVIPLLPHHVTQRGNRRQDVFLRTQDYRDYRALLAEHTRAEGVEVWAWCLMPNHVHLMLVPPSADALRAALSEAHRRYSRMINIRQEWQGYLWQGRFASCPMDMGHTMAAARYIELNPVRAKLAALPQAWEWSSARAHLFGTDDGLTNRQALLRHFPDWQGFLNHGLDDSLCEDLRRGERTGRPLGDEEFVKSLEAQTGRVLARRKPGPKPKGP